MWDIPYKIGMPLSLPWGKGTRSSVISPRQLFCDHEWNPQSPFNPHRGCLLVTREKGLFFSLFQIALWLPFSHMKACLTGESFSKLLFRHCGDTLKLSWAVDVEKSTTWPGWFHCHLCKSGEGYSLTRPQDASRGGSWSCHLTDALSCSNAPVSFSLFSLSLTLPSQVQSWLAYPIPFSGMFCASFSIIHQVPYPLLCLAVVQLLKSACKPKA